MINLFMFNIYHNHDVRIKFISANQISTLEGHSNLFAYIICIQSLQTNQNVMQLYYKTLIFDWSTHFVTFVRRIELCMFENRNLQRKIPYISR